MKTEDDPFGRGAKAAPRSKVLIKTSRFMGSLPTRRGLLVAPTLAALFFSSGLLAGRVGAPAVTAATTPPVVRHVFDPTLRPRRHVAAPTFQPGNAAFSLQADGRPLPFQVQAIPALPGQTIELHTGPMGSETAFTLRVREGEIRDGIVGWSWTAPSSPGAYPLEIEEVATGESVSVTVLVAHPAEALSNGRLHGFSVGRYMEIPFRGDPAYLPPPGFIEVPHEHFDLAVSPHFALGQFLCKQDGERRFLLLSPDLVTKLEAGLEALNEDGYFVPTFHVMSGYRTPAYNRAIGNTSVYSRHLYGDAVDIFVDVDGDGYMDDFNGDGRRDMADARKLLGYFEGLARHHKGDIKAGGLGLYGPKPHRGPFLHVDTRGTPARW